MADCCDPDLMLITETKLDSSIFSSELLPKGYVGEFRRDRNLNGGGAMIQAGLQQMQREPTRGQTLLDLFCCNKPSLVKLSDHSIVLADCDLKALQVKIRKKDN